MKHVKHVQTWLPFDSSIGVVCRVWSMASLSVALPPDGQHVTIGGATSRHTENMAYVTGTCIEYMSIYGP